jgi:hypothetical protein
MAAAYGSNERASPDGFGRSMLLRKQRREHWLLLWQG